MAKKNQNNLSDLEKSNLLQKATNASFEGITISSMTIPDQPLIFINEGFLQLTGYTHDEVIGKNCRFLQGQDTDPMVVDELREAIANEKPCTVELLNYKKNGTPFWNRLSITPIRDESNKVTHYVGVQSDITQLKQTKDRLKSANDELRIFKHRIINELDQAKRVQQFLLPGELPSNDKMKISSLFVPMDEIGGDFYDVVPLGDQKYGLLIADVSGHGIPAALLTFMSSTTFKNISPNWSSTSETIRRTNKRLFQKMPDDAFVTMFYAIYDSSDKTLIYTQAGHPESFILRTSSQEIIPLNTGGPLLGPFSDDEVQFPEKSIQLTSGDKLVMYTDAISDTFERNRTSGEENSLREFLLKNGHLPLEQLFKSIYDIGLGRMRMNKYNDDFTLLGLEIS